MANLRGQSVLEFRRIVKATHPVSPECSGVNTPLLLESGLCSGQSFAWIGFAALRVPEDVESRVSVSALAFAQFQDDRKPSSTKRLQGSQPRYKTKQRLKG